MTTSGLSQSQKRSVGRTLARRATSAGDDLVEGDVERGSGRTARAMMFQWWSCQPVALREGAADATATASAEKPKSDTSFGGQGRGHRGGDLAGTGRPPAAP